MSPEAQLDPQAGQQSQRRLSRSLIPLAVLALLSLVPIAIAATRMRLIADDYIFASQAMQDGVVGGAWYWFEHHFGGLTYGLVASAFGWLAGSLPFSIGYVPYVAFVLGLVGLTVAMYARLMFRSMAWGRAALLGVIGAALWVVGIGNLGGSYDTTVLFGYLNCFSMGPRPLAAWLFLLTLGFLLLTLGWALRYRFLVGALAGVVGALSLLNLTPDVVGYAFLWVVVALLSWWGRGHVFDRRLATGASGVVLGYVGAVVLLWISPGTQDRRSGMVAPSPGSFAESVLTQSWVYARELMNVSMGLVLIAGIALGLLLALGGHSVSKRLTGRGFLLLVGFGLLVMLVLTVTGSAGSTLSYGAIWHRWGVQQIEFFLVLFMGWVLGSQLAPRVRHRRGLETATVVLCALIVLSAAVPGMRVLVVASDREAIWSTGAPAPVDFMIDREVEWVEQAWIEISRMRHDGA